FNNISSGFLVENVGNNPVTLNFSCSGSCTAATFIGNNGTSPLFQFRVVNSTNAKNNTADTTADTTGSCRMGTDGGWNYSDWTNMVASTAFDLCGGTSSTKYFFNSTNTEDAVVMDLLVSIPADLVSPTGGAQTATITFRADSSG
ncbi:hypothetical protein HYX12_01255, partial [Candidatus Woesearchaeota archaeon]|nr:hypothetical protein [Candidatus Woesearchaeota archaeon]